MKNLSPVELHKNLLKKINPSLRWDGKTPIQEWKKICKEKLNELLGMDTFEKCEPDFKIIKEEILNGNKHIHFLVQTEEGYYSNCHLLLPQNMEGKRPLCTCLQGHVSGAHISLGIDKFEYDSSYINDDRHDFCVQAVKEGFVGLAIEQRGFGENGGDTDKGWTRCQHPAIGAILIGRTLIGERVWDVSRVIDFVEQHFGNIITMEKSVLLGTSGGGTATFYTACLEDRFDTYIPGVAFCSYYDSIICHEHCTCNYIPNIAKYFDMGDLSILIAPKKVIFLNATEDRWFPLEGAKREFETVKKIYKEFGKEDNAKLVIAEGGHSFYPEQIWPMIK